MHGLPSALMGLVLTMLTSSTAASFLRRQTNDGSPSASQYTDAETNITFLGYAPASTGFQFGMALPSSPTTDLIVQLVSQLNDDGGGYAAIDFGAEMTGYLMIAAWPDASGAVKVSPRIATGYEVSNGANVYTASNITITPIAEGTFVNATHVSATFICGGCIVANSFQSAVTKGTATTSFSYAYSLTTVSDPSDVDTQLSDHTLQGELYGPFDVALKSAQSSQYETWVGLTKAPTATATASAGAGGSASEASATASASAPGETAASSGSSSSTSSSLSSTSEVELVGLSPAAIVALVGLGLVYILQAVQIL